MVNKATVRDYIGLSKYQDAVLNRFSVFKIADTLLLLTCQAAKVLLNKLRRIGLKKVK